MRMKFFLLQIVICCIVAAGCAEMSRPAEKSAAVPAAPAAPAPAAAETPAPAAKSDPAKPAFQPPVLSHPDSWSLVVVPDVQAYVERPRNHGILDIMNSWIVENREALKISQVLFTGDLVFRNDPHRPMPARTLIADEQWKAFSRLMKRLDGEIPYILCTGNHDYGRASAESRDTHFGEYFPTDRNPLTRRELVECAYNGKGAATLENAAYEFTAPAPDNRKFLVISLEFAPRDNVLKWAKNLADQPRFANHIGIVLTHSYLRRNGERFTEEKYKLSKAGGNAGEGIFRKLVYPAKNIRLVVCGHIAVADKWEGGVVFSTDRNSSGKTVAQMAFNTQAIGGGFHGSGGDGWLRLLEFMPDRKTVKATTFSPLFAISPSTRHLAWRHEPLNEFTFELE